MVTRDSFQRCHAALSSHRLIHSPPPSGSLAFVPSLFRPLNLKPAQHPGRHVLSCSTSDNTLMWFLCLTHIHLHINTLRLSACTKVTHLGSCTHSQRLKLTSMYHCLNIPRRCWPNGFIVFGKSNITSYLYTTVSLKTLIINYFSQLV